MDPGTRNFFLSISGNVERADFSTMTGILSGYFVRIRLASADLFSNYMKKRNPSVDTYRMRYPLRLDSPLERMILLM